MNRVFNATLSERLQQAIPEKSQRINSASFFAWNFSEPDEAVKANFVVLVNFLEYELLGIGNEEEDITWRLFMQVIDTIKTELIAEHRN